MKLSIITISYNNIDGLRLTLHSVLQQSYTDFEYIVVDGGSKDGSKEFLLESESYFVQKGITFKWVSEQDAGIYNAMNKGVKMATGRYCNFMNAGDYFANSDVVANVFSHSYDCFDILIGRAQTTTRVIEPPVSPTLGFFYEKKSINHQAAFIKRELLEKYPYDETGLIVSDWKFFLEALIVEKCSYFPLDELIVIFDSNGIGSQDIRRNRKEQNQILQVYFNDRVLSDIERLTYYRYPLVDVSIKMVQTLIRLKELFSLKSYDNNLRLSKKVTKWLLFKRMVRELKRRIEIHRAVGRNVQSVGVNVEKRSCPIIVSFTSYPARMNTISQTIESLLTQSVKPDKLILWLTASQFPNREADIPYKVLRYIKYGLEIRWCNVPIKSYTKLLPTLKEYPDAIVVVADDDILYRRNWLKGLYKAYQQNPNSIYGYCASRVELKNNTPITYNSWTTIDTSCTANTNVLLGVGGVLYPPHSLHNEVLNQAQFSTLAPTTDDLWFWAMALLKGTSLTVIHNENSFALQVIGVNNDEALFNTNSRGGNDHQLHSILTAYPSVLSKIL